MNLLCPSCQNPLSVPEQYAGQLMKCPLCNNNFTVPALATVTPEPSIALAPEGEAHDSTPIDLSGHIPPPFIPPPANPPEDGEHGLYGITPEPTAPSPPAGPADATAPAPAGPPRAPRPAPKPPQPAPRSGAPVGYTRSMAATLNPAVVPWIAPVCLVLVFILSFFPWVGIYYGSYGVVTQSGWGAAFGGYTVDELFDQKTGWDKTTPNDQKPGPGALMIFFLLLGLIPAVPIAVAAAALPYLKRRFRLPPVAEVLEPWRWLVVTGATLLALLFLFLQLVSTFSIESRTREKITAAADKERIGANALDSKWIDMQEAKKLADSGLRRTAYLRFSFILLIVAAAGAATAHWLEHRGAGRPLPRVEILW